MKRKIIFIIGSFLLGIGIGLTVLSGFGSDPLAVLAEGISKTINLNFSFVNYILYFLMVVVSYCIDKKLVTIMTFSSPFITSIGIEVCMQLMNKVSWIGFVVGVIVLSFGISLSIEANVGKSPYDALIYCIMNKFDKQYSVVRWGLDTISLALGFMLKGTIGIGTIILLLVVGKLVQGFCGSLLKINA